MQRIIISFIVLMMVMVYVVTPFAKTPEPLQWLEFLAYDMKMQYASLSAASAVSKVAQTADKATTDAAIDTRIVVVDIDEDSQGRFGRWPWPRDLTARLIETLGRDYQASWIGLDAHFPYQVYHGDAADQRLAEVLQTYSPVMALRLITTEDQKQGVAPMHIGEAGSGALVQALHGNVPTSQLGQAVGYVGNLPLFVSQQRIVGHITPIDDSDSKKRRLNLLYQLDKRYFSTLALALWRQSLGADGLIYDDHLNNWLDSPKWYLSYGGQPSPYYVPVNENGEVLIPYHNRVQTVSASKILNKEIALNDLAGKFILVGSSAEAQGDDLVATPLNPRLPGVEIHAVMLSAMLDQSMDGVQSFKIQPSNEKWLQLILLVVTTGILLFARSFGIRSLLSIAPLLLLSWIGLNYWLWARWNLAIAVFPLVILITVMMTYIVVNDLLEINARHQHVRKMFSFYLPEPVVQRIANDRTGRDWLKPERRDMSVLFADMRGFTRMSETMPPEAVADITSQLFTELTDVIHKQGGTVDKYMGDAVMAFWGAPLVDTDHALHATQAACAMQQAVTTLNETKFAQQNIQISLGIGINTGIMLVGNLGSAQRHAYTVMGSVVNIASAIQQLTRESQYEILVSEEAAARLPDQMTTDLGLLSSKKFSHKIRVFGVNLAAVV